MPTTPFPRVPSAPNNPDLRSLAQYVSQLANLLASFSKEMDYLLNGSIDANNIRANSITAKLIQAGAITADKIEAGAVTADKIDVDELSAISADLGTITAGLVSAITMTASTIIGSYIATSQGTFPFCEMSTTDNLFRAFGSSEDDYVGIVPDFLGNGPGNLLVNGGSTQGGQYAGSLSYHVQGISDLHLEAGTDIYMQPNGTTGVIFNGFAEIYGTADGQNLRQALDALSARITALGG